MQKLKKTMVSFILVVMMAVLPAGETVTLTNASAETMVYVTPTGRKYHTHKCGRGNYYQVTLSAAKARGLTPCAKCYGGSSSGGSGSTKKPSGSPKLTISSSRITLVKGKSRKLTAKCGSKKVRWKSSNQKVAVVSSGGKVTAKGKGKATVTAVCGNQKKTCRVTVEEPGLNRTSLKITEGETAALKLKGCSHDVTWTSTDTDICSVYDGIVEAWEAGTATIKAKVHGKVYKCRVVVTAEEPSYYELSEETIVLESGETDYLYISDESGSAPDDAETKVVSSDSSVVTAEYEGDGEISVYAVSSGSADIMVTIGDITIVCHVTVYSLDGAG